MRVLLVAPKDEQLELRRRFSSLEYEIVAACTPEDIPELTADVALVKDPTPEVAARLRGRGLKVVGFGRGDRESTDAFLDEPSAFAARALELFRAAP
jgi:hypothetical protein